PSGTLPTPPGRRRRNGRGSPPSSARTRRSRGSSPRRPRPPRFPRRQASSAAIVQRFCGRRVRCHGNATILHGNAILATSMRVLVIGGTSFLGPFVVRQLSDLGHHITVFHRGEHEPELPSEVRHVHSPSAGFPVTSFPPGLTELASDVVLHMSAMGEADARAARETFRGTARRIVVLSSGDVYRAYGVATGIE